jgi:subtilase family serine protease
MTRTSRRRWQHAIAVFVTVIVTTASITGCRDADPPVPPAGPMPTTPPPLAACTRPSPLPCDASDPLHEVYGTGQLFARGVTGAGTTVAVVMPSIGSNGLSSDLAVFDRYYHLPSAQLQVIRWDHARTQAVQVAVSWDLEADLDLEMIHFMAPAARLLVVILPASAKGACDFTEMHDAMTALGALTVPQHIDVASFSWGAFEPALARCNARRQLAAIRPGLQTAVAEGLSVIAGSGDSGPTGWSNPAGTSFYHFRAVFYPTSDPLVTGVGGTTVDVTSRGTLARPETVGRQVYGGQTFTGGGGRSALFPRPAWQDSVANITGDHRGVVDVSMDAQTLAYLKVPGQPTPGWASIGGTSVSAPLFAGIVADAAQQARHPLGLINPALYQMHSPADGILDITRGNNTDHGVTGYSAGPGYDLPTGIGTIGNATLFVTALARLDQHL